MLSTPLPKLAISLSRSPDWLSTARSMWSVTVGTMHIGGLGGLDELAWVIGLSSC